MHSPHDDVDRARTLLVSIPGTERPAFLPADALDALAATSRELRIVDPADLTAPDAFAAALADVDVAVVAWGFPRLDGDRLDRAPELRLLVNAASSVHHLVSPALWARGVEVTQAGDAMAPAVAEMSLALTLTLLRRIGRMDHALRGGATWQSARDIPRAREIAGARIGVLGASRTGRRYIGLVRALGAEVRVADPYVTPGDPLHPLTVPLDALLADCDVLALHAPETAETTGILDARRISLLRPGTAVVNTARGGLVDEDALYDAAAAGRLDVALDVHAAEPLPPGDRWRDLPNVVLTGHVGGATVDSRRRAGEIVLAEVRRHRAGSALRHRVDPADLGHRG